MGYRAGRSGGASGGEDGGVHGGVARIDSSDGLLCLPRGVRDFVCTGAGRLARHAFGYALRSGRGTNCIRSAASADTDIAHPREMGDPLSWLLKSLKGAVASFWLRL